MGKRAERPPDHRKIYGLTSMCEVCERPIVEGQTWKYTPGGGKVHYYCGKPGMGMNPAKTLYDFLGMPGYEHYPPGGTVVLDPAAAKRMAKKLLTRWPQVEHVQAESLGKVVFNLHRDGRLEYSNPNVEHNPIPRGYEHVIERTRANEAIIAPYVGKLTVTEYDGQKYVLTGVNDVGVLYWSKPRQKKQFVLGYYIKDLERLAAKSNPEGPDTEALVEALRSGKVPLWKIQRAYENALDDILHNRSRYPDELKELNRARLEALRVVGMSLEPRDLVYMDGRFRGVYQPGSVEKAITGWRASGKTVARIAPSLEWELPPGWRVWSVVSSVTTRNPAGRTFPPGKWWVVLLYPDGVWRVSGNHQTKEMAHRSAMTSKRWGGFVGAKIVRSDHSGIPPAQYPLAPLENPAGPTYREALAKARAAGARIGDTDGYGPWLQKSGLAGRGPLVLRHVKEAFDRGVEEGDGKPAATARQSYHGTEIWKTAEGWKTSLDPDSLFDTVKDARKFVDAQRQNPASYEEGHYVVIDEDYNILSGPHKQLHTASRIATSLAKKLRPKGHEVSYMDASDYLREFGSKQPPTAENPFDFEATARDFGMSIFSGRGPTIQVQKRRIRKAQKALDEHRAWLRSEGYEDDGVAQKKAESIRWWQIAVDEYERLKSEKRRKSA